MQDLTEPILELVRLASTELPLDVEKSLRHAVEQEELNAPSRRRKGVASRPQTIATLEPDTQTAIFSRLIARKHSVDGQKIQGYGRDCLELYVE